MKTAKKLLLAAVLILGAMLLAQGIGRAWYVYPTVETQSHFLRSYTPAQVVDLFKQKENSHSGHNAQDAAGRKFATHTAEWTEYFVVATANQPVLSSAIRDDVTHRLTEEGARIISQTDSSAGSEIRYEVGNTRGLVAIDPLHAVDPATVVGKLGVSRGDAAVMLRVRIVETWSERPGQDRADWPTLSGP